ncbi:MAG TPA: HEAT repeat domain-containing protein [Candidatus Dormibacteraeota bacterium]|nr:HEAT repeat domain-containing protein [Candidatus Dormibacteraeota bacterium]
MVFLLQTPCASAQQITGRFYPEKDHYLVGEPVIVDFEVVNGTDKAAEIDNFDCPWMTPRQFEVGNASPKKKIGLFGCTVQGIAGDCLGSTVEIPAGGKYLKRLLLEGPFELDFPGSYHIRASREQEIRAKGTHQVLADLKVESEFYLTLEAPTESELEAAYGPFFKDLRSNDLAVRYFAASAVTQNPPPFAEAAILALANDPQIPAASIEGLARLATPAARAKLLQMSSTKSPEYLRQPAIEALGEIANSDDCQAMLDIASQNKNYTQGEAYIVSGHICKEQAIPTLLRALPTADSQLPMYLATAFGNTQSRNAVPPLITLLANPDELVRRDAEEALATLTHRKSVYGIANADSARQSYMEWSNWWAVNGKTASLYGPDTCAEPQPLR